MTKMAIKRAFQKLDTAEQAEMLGELASTLAKDLADMDRQDARVFEARRNEEENARPSREVRRRLGARKPRRK